MSAPSLKTSAKSVIILVVIAAALFAVDIAVYVVSSGSLDKCEADLSAKQDQVENSRKIAQRLGMSRAHYLEASDQLRELESSVTPAAYIPTLLKQLESTGKQVNLKVLSVRPRPEPPAEVNSAAQDSSSSQSDAAKAPVKKVQPKPYDTLLIDIEVEGNYYNTMDFLHRLTRFPKIVAVDTIQIMPTSHCLTARKSPTLTAKLSVRAFVFPAETKPGAGVAIETVQAPLQPAPEREVRI